MLPIDAFRVAALRPCDPLSWRALGNREVRHGEVVANYPAQGKLWATCEELELLEDGLLVVVEYRQVTACGSRALSTTSSGD